MNFKNQTIFTGDNLPIMRGMNSACVDLIYLDPPFNSNHDYAAPIGSEAAGAAFKDTWGLKDIDIAWLDLIEAKYPKVHRIIKASLSRSDMSYLIYMAPRLIEMKRLLKDTGSIYLHCDPTMSHYLKLLMDAIFGRSNFRNEIIWNYGKWSNAAKFFQRNHDTILFYTKGENYTFNPLYVPKREEKSYHTNIVAGQGQLLIYDRANVSKKIIDDYAKKNYKIVYVANRGVLENDTWTSFKNKELNILNSQAKERCGYPTQKPIALLERIIKASSNKGDMVFDPFCGCATTCVAAQRLGREWVGIDLSSQAVKLTKMRMNKEMIIPSSHHKGIHRTDIPKRTDLGKIPAYNSPANRKELYGEQGGHCNGCHEHFESRHLEVDHIIALAVGGSDIIDNLQLLCGSCNRVKGKRGMEYLTLKLNEFNR